MFTQGLEERPPPVMPQTLQEGTASAIGCEGLQGLSPVRPYNSGLQVTEGGTSCLRAEVPYRVLTGGHGLRGVLYGLPAGLLCWLVQPSQKCFPPQVVTPASFRSSSPWARTGG